MRYLKTTTQTIRMANKPQISNLKLQTNQFLHRHVPVLRDLHPLAHHPLVFLAAHRTPPVDLAQLSFKTRLDPVNILIPLSHEIPQSPHHHHRVHHAVEPPVPASPEPPEEQQQLRDLQIEILAAYHPRRLLQLHSRHLRPHPAELTQREQLVNQPGHRQVPSRLRHLSQRRPAAHVHPGLVHLSPLERQLQRPLSSLQGALRPARRPRPCAAQSPSLRQYLAGHLSSRLYHD